MTESKQICGADLLRNPQLNRADAFTQEERDARGLRGLLPPAVSTMELQVKRTLALLDRCPTALDKFLMLDSLHATDEDLYFKSLIAYIDDYMPVVYTPTVGEVCQKFSHIYRYPRGAFISINDKGRVREIIENCPNEEVDVIVVTDGQRILGLGDLGINGMGIPCGKLSLYTACAGIAPEKTLPVTIDVGTNNPEYLNDPMYLGLRQERVTGEAYDELIEEFVTEARRRWPNVLIQFEDFGNNHAFDLLERYKDKVLCFNDDIQGTAAVAVTGVYSALRVTKQKLADQRFLFLGAGEAATGIAELLVDAMVAEGVEREDALKHCFLFDSKGLVTCNRGDKLAHNKVPFAHDVENCKTFIEAVRDLSLITPNLYIPDYGSKMTSSIYIRGIGARIDQPAIGLYVDNIPYLNKNNYDFGFYDIRQVEVLRGPNIKPLPQALALTDDMALPCLLKVGDNITTDHIMPAGSKILPYRSNIPYLANFCFEVCDADFAKRAMKAEGGFIVGGANYGQGSSREHAALVPLYLGIRAVIAKSFARIHKANLVNAGILPLEFKNEQDYEKVFLGQRLSLSGIFAGLEGGTVSMTNVESGETFELVCDISARQAKIIRAGGLLNYTKQQQK